MFVAFLKHMFELVLMAETIEFIKIEKLMNYSNKHKVDTKCIIYQSILSYNIEKYNVQSILLLLVFLSYCMFTKFLSPLLATWIFLVGVSSPAHSIDDCLAQNHFGTKH